MIVPLIFAMFACGGGEPATPKVDFDRDVRPILETSCFRCHGPHAKRIRGGLMMAGRQALLKGGDSGPAIVANDPEHSLLLRMVRYESEDFEMPPTGPLDPQAVRTLERWVAEGAVWPGGDTGPSDRREIDLEQGRQWWAYRPVVRPQVPVLDDPDRQGRVRNQIDRFVEAKLAVAGLEAVPEAEPRQLVRRLYIDLLGIQPSIEELEVYLRDERSDKWSRLIDELLNRKQYGERWGRYWLDVVRFAQTNGYERDQEKQYIWRYRDYVIDAYNADKPYDQFLREQLAGDELEVVSQESLIATGFYSLGMWDTEPNDPEQAIFDAQDDVLRTISEGLLATTVGCARCHDHRFDPVRQTDYYSLLAFIRNVEPYAKPKFNFESRTHRLFEFDSGIQSAWERGRSEAEQALKQRLKSLRAQRLTDYVSDHFDELIAARPELANFDPSGLTIPEIAKQLGVTDAEVKQAYSIEQRINYLLLEGQYERLEDSFDGGLPWIMAVSESGTEPVPTYVLRRGMAAARLEPVEAKFLAVLCPDDESAQLNIEPHLVPGSPARSTSGQRLALANWIANPKHPITARVMVNRIWQKHFGQGLVRTPDDFGTRGEAPSHPLLLDWLADEFVANGWSIKSLHRLILNSAVYRRSSNFKSAQAELVDPDNRLLWRRDLRRLDSEALHDSILAVCGDLNSKAGGRGFFPALSLEAISGSSRPGGGWQRSSKSERDRRAVYSFVKRGLLVPFLTTFDFPDPSFTRGERSSTTVANQALTLLNGSFANRASQSLARALMRASRRDLADLVRSVYRRVLIREPSESELKLATGFLANEAQGFAALPPRLTFRNSLPNRVEVEYLSELSGEDLVSAPREAWQAQRGEWGNGYNMTLEADPDRGPFALLRKPEFANGRISLGLNFEKGCERVSFLLRTRVTKSTTTGLQVVFDIGQQVLKLLQIKPGHDSPIELKFVPCQLEPEIDHAVALQLFKSNLTVSVDGKPCLVYQADASQQSLIRGVGKFGVRVRGAAVHLDGGTIRANQTVTELSPDDPGDPLEKALALLCQTVMSLNEFLYVD